MPHTNRKPGRPTKFRTEHQRTAAKSRQTRASQKKNGHQNQIEYHKRTGYAAQKSWRARKKEAERLQQLANQAVAHAPQPAPPLLPPPPPPPPPPPEPHPPAL